MTGPDATPASAAFASVPGGRYPRAVATDPRTTADIARERIEHVVVLMLENRSFDHMLGFLSHPDLPPLTPGAFANPVDPADQASPAFGVSDDAGYALPVDPPHSHLSVMKQFGRRPPTMDGFVSAYTEKALGKELLPIIHWWRIEILILASIAVLTVFSRWADLSWIGAAALGLALVLVGSASALRLRRVLARWWLLEVSVVVTSVVLAVLSRPLNARPVVAVPIVIGLAGAGTLVLLWFRSRPLYRRPDDLGQVPDMAGMVMRCMPEDRVPVLSTLARGYAVCTRWHCSVPGETWPNRNFAIAATSDDAVGIEFGLYESPTIFERLAEARRSWRIYHHGMAQAMVFRKLWELGAGNWFDVARFEEHAAAGDLATYSFIEPGHVGPTSNSQHPGNNFEPHGGRYDFERGEELIASIYGSLRRNPRLFEKTLFLITYDEHGGLFDHIPPPTDAVAPTLRKAAVSVTRRFISLFVTYRGTKFDFRMLGARVPTVVVSPWVAEGRVDDTLYDHTSIVATLRTLFAPQASPLSRRDRRANTFDHLVTELAEARAPDDLPDLPSPRRLDAEVPPSPRVEVPGLAEVEPDVAVQLAHLADLVEGELERTEPAKVGAVSDVTDPALGVDPEEPHAVVVDRFHVRSERGR